MSHSISEKERLAEEAMQPRTWSLWGPYVFDRQWGTVREDYSPQGTAWEYFPHDHSRSRAYRWGEDGIAGICDDWQYLCLAMALELARHNPVYQDIASELGRRLTRLFLKGNDGQRPVLRYHPKLATDPHFRDYLLFHKYFHADTSRGVGASQQTGWTGLVAKLLQPRG